MIGIVLCGGQSTRMRKDKGLLISQGKRWAEIIKEKFSEISIPSVLSINPAQKKKYLAHFNESDLVVDLDFAQIIIVAVNDGPVSEWVHLQAKAKGKLINVADTPGLCDFYLGSIVNKGHLKIAISTNGKSPTIAKRLKEIFTDVLPDMDELLHNLNAIRNKLKGNLSEKVRV